MTNPRRTLSLLLVAPVALAALALAPTDSLGTAASRSASAAEVATKCVGVEHAAVQLSRCVPFPDAQA